MPEPSRFMQWLFKYLDRAEAVILVLIIVGVVCHLIGLSFARPLMEVSFKGLAAVFFLNAFRAPASATDEPSAPSDFLTRLTQNILPKALWISCSMGAVVIVFGVSELPGLKEQSQIFLAASAGCIVLLAGTAALGRNVQHLTPVLYRLLPLALAAGHYVGYY